MKCLANRSNREYPNNAIYEILTRKTNKDDISEPMVYPLKVRRLFDTVLRSCPGYVIKAYIHVFQEGNTLEEAARKMGCSAPTVRKYLDEIYMLKYKDVYIPSVLSSQ